MTDFLMHPPFGWKGWTPRCWSRLCTTWALPVLTFTFILSAALAIQLAEGGPGAGLPLHNLDKAGSWRRWWRSWHWCSASCCSCQGSLMCCSCWRFPTPGWPDAGEEGVEVQAVCRCWWRGGAAGNSRWAQLVQIRLQRSSLSGGGHWSGLPVHQLSKPDRRCRRFGGAPHDWCEAGWEFWPLCVIILANSIFNTPKTLQFDLWSLFFSALQQSSQNSHPAKTDPYKILSSTTLGGGEDQENQMWTQDWTIKQDCSWWWLKGLKDRSSLHRSSDMQEHLWSGMKANNVGGQRYKRWKWEKKSWLWPKTMYMWRKSCRQKI